MQAHELELARVNRYVDAHAQQKTFQRDKGAASLTRHKRGWASLPLISVLVYADAHADARTSIKHSTLEYTL